MSETAQRDFAALLAAAGQGDADALAELVQQYEPKVRLVARVLLGPALRPYVDSLDLVQSVHKSLLLGLRRQQFDISDPDKLMGLALTLVRRKVARHWRRQQRQQRLSLEQGAPHSLADLLTSLTSPPTTDPARTAEFRDQVVHLCNHLSDSERRLLDLRLQGYSPAETAEQLGMNPVTLRVRLTRLRQRLQDSGILTDWL